MMNATSRNATFGILGVLALGILATGCTAGVLVDENYNTITDWRTGGASITFVRLGDDLRPDGTQYQFDLNGQPYVSFDAYADDGATTASRPGLVNSKKFIPSGNYSVEFFQRGVGYARSRKFYHDYDSNGCRDSITGNQDDYCAEYYFRLNYNCPSCTGPDCGGVQTLPTHNAFPVIDMCTAF